MTITIKHKQTKKASLVALALSIQMLAMLSVPAMALTFSDTQGHWAQSDIEKLTDQSVLSGYEDGTFHPDQAMTRGEFLEAFKRAYDMNPVVNTSTLPTYESLKSNSSQLVMRAEVLSVIAEALGTPKGETSSVVSSRSTIESYSDASEVPTWARGNVSRTIQYGVFANTPTRSTMISPTAAATRAEVAVLLDNMLTHNQMVASVNTNPDRSSVETTLATPLYTRFNDVGDPVVLVLNETMVTPDGKLLVPGTKLYGEVTEVKKASAAQSGRLGITFDKALTPTENSYDINATMAISGGIADMDNLKDILTISKTRSFGQLRAEVRSEMGAVVGTDAGKMKVYHDSLSKVVPYDDDLKTADSSKDILLGVGDRLRVRFE